MRARSAPGLPISTVEANRKAPFDVWTCNFAATDGDYGRGVSAALKQAGLSELEPFMLCEAENTRTVTRVVAAFTCIWLLVVARVVRRWLTFRLAW